MPMSDDAEPTPVNPWPRVDEFMSDEDLTAAAQLLRDSVNWERLPKLREIFEHRPVVNRYWHELVALTLVSLEKNGDTLNKRNALCRGDESEP